MYYILHQPGNKASDSFVEAYGTMDGVHVISGYDESLAFHPVYQGFPTVIYEDERGQRHSIFDPVTMEAVEAWREGIDNPKKVSLLSKYDFSQRFHRDEMIGILALRLTDPVVGLFLQLMDYAQDIDLSDVNIQSGIGYLVSIGKLTQDRATAILAR